MRRLNYEQRDLGFSFALATGVMLASALVLSLLFGGAESGWQFWVMQSLYTLLIGLSGVVFAAVTKTDFFAASKLNKAPHWSHLLWGCGAVVFLVFCMSQINSLFLDVIESTGLGRPSVSLDDSLVGLIVCACVMPAFTEEILFRGTVAQTLYNHKNKLAALAISGALFALFHGNPAQTLHQFVLGAFLTLLVYRSGSLWTSVIVHFFNNAFVVAMSYTPLGADEFWSFQTNPVWAWIFTVGGIVGFALCVFGYVKTTKSSWQSDRQAEQDGQSEQVSDDGEQAEQDEEKKLRIAGYTKRSKIMLWVAIGACAVLWIAQLFL